MSNLYGYTDYNGPETLKDSIDDSQNRKVSSLVPNDSNSCEFEMIDQPSADNTNPLQVGFWMDGDSLAPPCGSSVSTVHKILEIAFDNTTGSTTSNSDCCLYDFGCGDGRVCLEAYAKYNCPVTVGVELETDLVERAQYLVSKLPRKPINDTMKNGTEPGQVLQQVPKIVQMDLRDTLDQLVTIAEKSNKNAKTSLSNNLSSQTSFGLGRSSSVETQYDLPLPTIIILYLLPEALAEIEPRMIRLLELIPNLKIICNTWGFPNLHPLVENEIYEENSSIVTSLFVYTTKSLMRN